MLSDINKVALAMEGLQKIQIVGTVDKLNSTSLNAFVKGIDGLTLSQAQAALSTRALTDAQKEQILTSANLLKTKEALGLEEVKQMASSMSLSAQKKEEILTTLQGAIVENEWNEERLEAIVATGGEAGAIAQAILAKKAENVENVKNIAGRKALTVSLWEELKARLAIMATNPVAWIVGIVGAGIGLVALQKKLTKSLDECVEELDKYNSTFESAQNKIKSLDTELDTCTDRIEELQKLAKNGTISIIEQEELDRLKDTNEELDRNLRIQKEKAQLSAIEGAKSADEILSKTVESKYITSLQDFSGVGVVTEYTSWVSPEKELEAAISEYNRLSTEIDKLNKLYDNGTISANDYEKQLSGLTTQQTTARTRASEMSDILVSAEQAYKNLENTDGKLTTTQSNNLKTVENANVMYTEFLGTINDVIDASKELNDNTTSKNPDEITLPSLEELNKQLDTIQSAYKSVQSAIEEYNTQGYISVDTFQSLMDIAPEHLQYLMDEEGNLRLGTEAMNEYTSALIDNMAMKQMQSISTYVQGLEDEERALYLVGQAAEEGAVGLMDFATAELATLIASEKLSDTETEQITNMFENIIGWANAAKSNLFSGLGGAGSSATNDFKDSIENGIAFYKSELDAGHIDLKEYLDKSNALIDDYYDKGKISAVDYHEFKNQLLEDELDAQNKVIDAVTSHIDGIIDGIKEQQDEIQKKIDLLNDEAEAEKLAYDIEKARYDLARLQTQRTKKLYIQDKGYFYTTDNTAIREKQDELADLERDQIIAGLEKEKDALDDSIAELEKYKESWAEIPKLKEQAENELYAVSILGATWEQDILNNRTDALDSFKNNYLNIQKAIADGAWHYANETNKAQASIGSGETNGGASAFVDDVEITVEKYKTGGGIKRTLQYRHNGIEGGYPDASMSKDKKLEVLEKLATEEIPLKKNEVPIIARNDELLVNTPQQNMIYHNFETMKASMQSMPMDFRAVSSGNVYNNTSSNAPNITTTIGDIHLHEVQNADSFADDIVRRFPNKVLQKMHQR